MNILLVIADLGLGGAQQVVINLANELVRQGHCVWIYDVYPELRKEGMIQKIDSDVHLIDPAFGKIPFHHKALNSILYRSGLNKYYLKDTRKKTHRKALENVLRKNKIDTVNSHVFWADEFVLDELEGYHDRWWVTLHASYSNMLAKNNTSTEQIPSIFESAKGIIYLSDDELNSIREFSEINTPSKLHKVFNGIPLNKTDRFLKKSSEVLHILCASRAIKEKGWIELIDAVNNLSNSLELKLVFAGEGPELKNFTEKAKNNPNIIFHGYVQDIEQLIRESDLVVLPSYYREALPTILIESIFNDTPVIATDVAETRNIVLNSEGHCGIVISASRGKELTEELEKGIIDFVHREKNSFQPEAFNEARKIFSIETMAKNYLSLFQNN